METLRKDQKSKSTILPKFFLQEEHRKILIDWMAGLIGGFASVTVCAPLDLLRTRLMLIATTDSYAKVKYGGFIQTAKTVIQNEGIRGLYKGYNVTAFSIPLFHSLYFSTFYKAKRMINEKFISKEHDILTNVIASVCTGFICDTITCPLWVIRTRIQTQFLHKENPQKYRGMIDGLYKMYKEEGIGSFYKGLFVSYVGLSHAAILYPLYEQLKKKLKEYKGKDLTSLDVFFCSLFSKTVAMVITYPHVVIRARQQDERTPLNGEGKAGAEKIYKKGASMVQMITKTIKREGIRGLYSGLRIDLIRVLPSNAITFVMFEKTKEYLNNKLPKGI